MGKQVLQAIARKHAKGEQRGLSLPQALTSISLGGDSMSAGGPL
jgi:hypothetical protein